MMFVFSPDIGLGFTEASRLILFSRARTLGSSAPVRRSAGDEKTEQEFIFSCVVLGLVGWLGTGIGVGPGRNVFF